MQDMASVKAGDNIEVEYERKGKFCTVKKWAIQGDSVPATPNPVPAPVPAGQSYHKTAYGKSPEDRIGMTVGGAGHDASLLILEWVKAMIAEKGAEWFEGNWEIVGKAYVNLAAAMSDGLIDYSESHLVKE